MWVIVWQYCRLTMSVNQIILRKLGFLDKIFSKKTILFISNKVYKDPKAKKKGKHRQWPKKL